jgi:hypothetical protein
MGARRDVNSGWASLRRRCTPGRDPLLLMGAPGSLCGLRGEKTCCPYLESNSDSRDAHLGDIQYYYSGLVKVLTASVV